MVKLNFKPVFGPYMTVSETLEDKEKVNRLFRRIVQYSNATLVRPDGTTLVLVKDGNIETYLYGREEDIVKWSSGKLLEVTNDRE